jgi:hypothetical protein
VYTIVRPSDVAVGHTPLGTISSDWVPLGARMEIDGRLPDLVV